MTTVGVSADDGGCLANCKRHLFRHFYQPTYFGMRLLVRRHDRSGGLQRPSHQFAPDRPEAPRGVGRPLASGRFPALLGRNCLSLGIDRSSSGQAGKSVAASFLGMDAWHGCLARLGLAAIMQILLWECQDWMAPVLEDVAG